MIGKEKFVKYMSAIKKADEKNNGFDDAIRALNRYGEGRALIYTDEMNIMIEMVCDLMDIEYNIDDIYGDDIQYFIYECNWGKNDMGIVEVDGTEIHLNTIGELYDYIVASKSKQS